MVGGAGRDVREGRGGRDGWATVEQKTRSDDAWGCEERGGKKWTLGQMIIKHAMS